MVMTSAFPRQKGRYLKFWMRWQNSVLIIICNYVFIVMNNSAFDYSLNGL